MNMPDIVLLIQLILMMIGGVFLGFALYTYLWSKGQQQTPPDLGEQNCGNCVYWNSGECHSCPPEVGGTYGRWPKTLDTWWCGNWEGK